MNSYTCAGNIGHIHKGSVVYDPYVGTGSLLLIAQQLQAGMTLGSDINREFFASTPPPTPPPAPPLLPPSPTLQDNFHQQHLPVPDLLLSNTLRLPFQGLQQPPPQPPLQQPLQQYMDAILTDVPYGFRKPR